MLIKSITKLISLERVSLNFAFNKIEELKYLETTLIELKTVNYLEIKLHKTDVELPKILELVESLKEELFVINFNLKMLKVSCDRNVPLLILKQKVEEICSAEFSTGKGRVLRCDVVGFDNKFYTIYIKKNDKLHSNRTKGGGMAVKKSPKFEMFPKMATMTEGYTLSNFNSNNKLSNICYQLYTSTDSFNNYICLTCCELKEMNKYMHYCKFCASNCGHAQLKDHYFVKAGENTRCVCAYSGCCKSDTKVVICGDKLGATIKK